MAALEFSIRQRIFLEVLLGQQRGSVEDIEVFFDIRNKVKLEDKESFLRSLPSGELIIDEVSAAAAGFEKIELEKEERKKLYDLIKTHKGFSPNDLEWVLPIKKQLELV
jgi:hypothetical protein